MKIPGTITMLLLTVGSSAAAMAHSEGHDGLLDHHRVLAAAEQNTTRAAIQQKKVSRYFEDRRKKLKVHATTVTDGGQVLDWVDPVSLLPPGRNKLANPPPEHDNETRHLRQQVGDDAKPVQAELKKQRHSRGPPGLVPILRVDPKTRSGDIGDVLSKYGNKNDTSTPDDADATDKLRYTDGHGYVHEYVSTRQYIDNVGGEARINLWNPHVHKTRFEFSLAQVALGADSNKGRQSVEVGWQESRQIYGDDKPHLFIYYTTNGYSDTGDYIGGYNTEVDGFVQLSDSVYPGMLLSPVSSFGGRQYEMPVRVELFEGNFWIEVLNEWVGYYPASLYSSPGLRNGASRISWYGEIIDDHTDSVETKTDMGSGKHAIEGWKKAAYMRKIVTYLPDGTSVHYDGSDFISVTDSDCYSLDEYFDNRRGDWNSYFFFGGPGCG